MPKNQKKIALIAPLILCMLIATLLVGCATSQQAQDTESTASNQGSDKQNSQDATASTKTASSTAQPSVTQAATKPLSTTSATVTPEGIPTPDNWATVNIYTTEGGLAFAPYKLYVAANDVKGIIWANQTNQEITVVQSDLPSNVSPASVRIAAHASQKVTFPKNQEGEYHFHIISPQTSPEHCTIIRQNYQYAPS
ncbi:hypothetical protein EPA93_35105 [Ktedonosporobacter rubrisoli]|uniref:Uncharacterized protein n=1 Tax=Ktedonosporobacter rubrisoli TaxID=2509675 RepID=A0A4P6JYU9_KTERU|nr:hypothetical protein [Ktedonosporobacter rubrisoli]QBD80919.1 hypothetical protein EPA93_35105 [Ktedonosporobacter rubrisoli]